MGCPAFAQRSASPSPSFPVPPIIPIRIPASKGGSSGRSRVCRLKLKHVLHRAIVNGVSAGVQCAARLEVMAIPGLPVMEAGADLPAEVQGALRRAAFELRGGDVVVLASKVVSRAEGQFVDLRSVTPSERALELARATRKEPRLVELILREATAVSRSAPGVIVVRHRLGFISANAGIDASNALPAICLAPRAGRVGVLLQRRRTLRHVARTREVLRAGSGAEVGVVVTDSFGRPFRLGTVGCAIGVAGIPALWGPAWRARISSGRGSRGITITALADQVAGGRRPAVRAGPPRRAALVVVRGVFAFPPSRVYTPPRSPSFA